MNTNVKEFKKVQQGNSFTDFQSFGSAVKKQQYQKTAGHTVMSYTESTYNTRQNFLYRKALKGLAAYDQKAVKKMHTDQINRVKKVHARALTEINILKQEKMISFTNAVLSIFHHSPFAKALVDNFSEPDKKFRCDGSWKDYGIDKEMVIDRLVDKRVLPHNFHSLE